MKSLLNRKMPHEVGVIPSICIPNNSLFNSMIIFKIYKYNTLIWGKGWWRIRNCIEWQAVGNSTKSRPYTWKEKNFDAVSTYEIISQKNSTWVLSLFSRLPYITKLLSQAPLLGFISVYHCSAVFVVSQAAINLRYGNKARHSSNKWLSLSYKCWSLGGLQGHILVPWS